MRDTAKIKPTQIKSHAPRPLTVEPNFMLLCQLLQRRFKLGNRLAHRLISQSTTHIDVIKTGDIHLNADQIGAAQIHIFQYTTAHIRADKISPL